MWQNTPRSLEYFVSLGVLRLVRHFESGEEPGYEVGKILNLFTPPQAPGRLGENTFHFAKFCRYCSPSLIIFTRQMFER